MAQALDRALADGWSDLHVLVECRTDDGFPSVEVFGNGVAIWNRERQFMLGRDQVKAHLEVFREAHFADMRETYGGKNDPVPSRKQAPRVTCRIHLELDGVSKQVVQLLGGRQSPELAELAHRVLEICREPARTGVTAEGLNNGLTKVARGDLAPEVLHVLVHRKASGGASGQGEESWILRVDGLNASASPYQAQEGYGEAIVVELASEDLSSLADSLMELGAQDQPFNLYAEHYTDVVVKVLNWERHVQARPFAGMTPTTHGERQKRFDAMFLVLQELQRRVLRASRKK